MKRGSGKKILEQKIKETKLNLKMSRARLKPGFWYDELLIGIEKAKKNRAETKLPKLNKELKKLIEE